MIEEKSEIMTAKQLADGCSKGDIDLSNSRQRGLVWEPYQKSLLIDSLIRGYPVPPIYIVDSEDEGMFVIDGKQRGDAISGFIHNEYALDKAIPSIELQSGEIYQLSGKTFNDLNDETQDIIKESKIGINYLKKATSDELDEIFYRLNGGTEMDQIIKTCTRARSISQINVAADHPLFQKSYVTVDLEKHKHKDIVVKSWILLTRTSNPTFDGKYLQKLMEEADISDDEILTMWYCFNRMLDIYTYVNTNIEDAETKKMIKMNLSKPSHFCLLMPIINRSLDEEIETGEFAKWIISFFPGTKAASIDAQYNEAAKSNTKKNLRLRYEILTSYYENAFPSQKKTASAS